MRRLIAGCTIVLACATGGARAASDVNLNVDPLAWRSMIDDLWNPVDEQVVIGGSVDFGHPGAPVHFAIGLSSSAAIDEHSDFPIDKTTGTVSELSFGVMKVWETKSRARPFAGGGASFVTARFDIDTVAGTLKDDDDALGLYVEGGVYWRLAPHFNFGLHGRVLAGAKIRLFDSDGSADYWQLGPMIGWSWPARR